VSVARLALAGDDTRVVTLDKVIQTMWEVGQDMKEIYKETSLGGLAKNVSVC
jgi:L-serine dehydratase